MTRYQSEVSQISTHNHDSAPPWLGSFGAIGLSSGTKKPSPNISRRMPNPESSSLGPPEDSLQESINPDFDSTSNMDPTPFKLLDPIIELLTTYNELNSPRIDELSEVPSALEFMRYVRANRPFVVRGAARDWSATRTWNVETLKDLLEGQSVQVAVTPAGYVNTVLESQE